MTQIHFQISIVSCGFRTFYQCKFLTKIDLPESLQSIGMECFYGCCCLKQIEISNSVSDFGKGCFFKCRKIPLIIKHQLIISGASHAFLCN
jgi:hypothetical protein